MDPVKREFEDLPSFLATLRGRNFFQPGHPVTIARAPGRLDVMGGIADYSGSLVLQRPIAEATFAALQQTNTPEIEIVSLREDAPARTFSMDPGELAPGGIPRDYDSVEEFFRRDEKNHWASYAVGAWIVLMAERGMRPATGARILISSAVPEGKGVASSAALEVAVMQAVCASFHFPLTPYDLALLCQKVENRVAGASCGVMDQMTAVFGSEDSLLALLCQPAELQLPVHVPQEIAFWGIDSGERHVVGGTSYESVRTGAFMGRRNLAIQTDREMDYLANIEPSTFERELLVLLPDEIRGEDFLSRYGETGDDVTSVVPSRVYKVRQPTAHPVYENARVRRFRELVQGNCREQEWTSMGELMYQSHASYSACGLGSPGTDAIVELVRAEGPKKGLFGARITGGGSGGTVAVLGRADAGAAIAAVAERYRERTAYKPLIFSGTSSGAATFGALSIHL
jgi:L-arabinokinase